MHGSTVVLCATTGTSVAIEVRRLSAPTCTSTTGAINMGCLRAATRTSAAAAIELGCLCAPANAAVKRRGLCSRLLFPLLAIPGSAFLANLKVPSLGLSWQILLLKLSVIIGLTAPLASISLLGLKIRRRPFHRFL